MQPTFYASSASHARRLTLPALFHVSPTPCACAPVFFPEDSLRALRSLCIFCDWTTYLQPEDGGDRRVCVLMIWKKHRENLFDTDYLPPLAFATIRRSMIPCRYASTRLLTRFIATSTLPARLENQSHHFFTRPCNRKRRSGVCNLGI